MTLTFRTKDKDGEYIVTIETEVIDEILRALEPNDEDAFREAYDLDNHYYLADWIYPIIGRMIVNKKFKIEKK